MSRKRILLIATVLALVVVFSLAVAAKLVDGTYSLRGKEDTRGNYPTISVVVKNGKISSSVGLGQSGLARPRLHTNV